jgi:oligopeptide transport system substrate-binding protein
MRFSLFLRAAAAGAALSLVVGACTGDEGSAEGPAATATGPTATPGESPTLASPSPGETQDPFEAEDAAVLSVAVQDPRSLDPMRIQNSWSLLVARQLYEGLTRWDPVREEVVPAAAESWKVTDKGKKFKFKLRAEMSFHDGTPVTAGDFRYAFNRIAQRKSASDLAFTLERVKGFQSVNRRGRDKTLSGIKAPNDSTLVIELDEPFYEFPAVLTHPGLVPLPKNAVEDIERFLTEPTGNGPFRMAAPWSGSGPIELEAFDDFYDAPKIDGVRFLVAREPSDAWLPFLDGRIDVAEVPVNQLLEAAGAYGQRGYKPLLNGYYYGFNLRARGIEQIRLRKAIGRAINREKIADEIYRGNLEPPRGIIPNGMPGFERDVCGTLCNYSRAAARRLVRKLPKKSRRVVLEFPSDEPNAPQHRQVARSVASDLRAARLKVRIRSYPFKKYLKKLRDNKMAFYRLGWSAEYPVADDFLSPLFESDSPDNHFGFASRKVDRLLADARREKSIRKRTKLYVKAEKLILAKAPILPLGFFMTHYAAQPRVGDIRFDVLGGFDAADVTLEEE